MIYLVLVLTFGFYPADLRYRHWTAAPVRAPSTPTPKWLEVLGILTFLVPVLIMTYYIVIGGWVTKYAVVYLTGQAQVHLCR